MKNIKYVIFDLDGVIIDSESIHFKAYKKAFESNGYDLTLEDFNKHIRSKGRKKGLKNIFGSENFKLKESISNKKSEVYMKLINKGNIEVFEDARDLIFTLKDLGIKLAVATGSENGDEILKKIGLLKKFEKVITSKELKKNKPNPEIYLKIKNELNADNEEILVIEDSKTGIEAALNASLRVVYIKRDDFEIIPDDMINNPKVKKTTKLDIKYIL